MFGFYSGINFGTRQQVCRQPISQWSIRFVLTCVSTKASHHGSKKKKEKKTFRSSIVLSKIHTERWI